MDLIPGIFIVKEGYELQIDPVRAWHVGDRFHLLTDQVYLYEFCPFILEANYDSSENETAYFLTDCERGNVFAFAGFEIGTLEALTIVTDEPKRNKSPEGKKSRSQKTGRI